MNREDFESLVGRLEPKIQQNPRQYQIKTLLLAMLGNVYLGSILLLLLAIMAVLGAGVMALNAIAFKLFLVVGCFLGFVIKSLWVKVDPPEGHEITQEQAPELFAMVEGLRCDLAAPRFHHVLLTDEFNAGVLQSPRLGLFGWHRNYLLIGLPLMKALSVEQFKAVLAHEFGHLSRGHGRFANWIYRQRLRWVRLLDALNASESRGGFLFKPFLNWFVPYFAAYSFPLARANEYEADATSARLTSSRVAAEALTSVCVIGNYLSERYWPQVYKQADDLPQPSFAPFHNLDRGVTGELDQGPVKTWLDRSMARPTDSADTHPALRDRLQGLGEMPRLAPPGPGQTADRLLGSALEPVTRSFDERWRNAVMPSWGERHTAVQDLRRRLADLDARSLAGDEISVEEACERARLTGSVGNRPDDALAQLQALHEQEPDQALVCFVLGSHLLDRNDANGCALIEKAIQQEQQLIARGCELLRDHHWANGNEPLAHAWHERLAARLQLEEEARVERDRVLLRDHFDPHGLPEADLAALRDALRQVPELRQAYFVQKRVVHFPESPVYVLGFVATPWFGLFKNKRIQEVTQKIQATVRFPGETIIFSAEFENRRFRRKLAGVAGARIV